MNRIENIILRVRDTLADHNGDRWPTDRLIRLIDEAQKDICRKAKLLRKKATLSVYDNQGTYKLPNDAMLLDRILYDNSPMPLVSHVQMDEQSKTWELDKGEPRYCVFDKQNQSHIKLWPIPQGISLPGDYVFSPALWQEDVQYLMNDDYGVIVEALTGDTFNDVYGVTVDISSFFSFYLGPDCTCDNLVKIEDTIESDYGTVTNIITLEKDFYSNDSTYGVVVSIDGYAMSSDYGIVVGLYDTEFSYENFSGEYGVMVGITVSNKDLVVYYLKKPDTITSVLSSLEIDDVFDNAIKYYVTGKALRDDMDTQNRVVGNEELGFYERELKEALRDDMLDFTRNDNKQYYTYYNGGI